MSYLVLRFWRVILDNILVLHIDNNVYNNYKPSACTDAWCFVYKASPVILRISGDS